MESRQAKKIVNAILENLEDRSRFDGFSGGMDRSVWREMKQTLADVVLAHAGPDQTAELIQLRGRVSELESEIDSAVEVAARHHRQAETIDPGAILDILGWPVEREGNGS